MTRILLLTAPRGAGKTTACERMIQRAREAGLSVGGILTPARYDASGAKSGFYAVDLASGEQRELAIVASDEAQRTVGRFCFDADALAWAAERALWALNAPLDVVVIDEIGPLELERGQGFASALTALPQARARAAILIVRTELALRLQELLRAMRPIVIVLTQRDRDQIPTRLLEEVWRRDESGRI